MPPKKSLEDCGIYLKKGQHVASISDCPERLKSLAEIILSVRSLEFDSFGGRPEGHHSIQSTPVMQYELELKLEASSLARNCNDYKSPDGIEDRWVLLQEPIVFYRFTRKNEEIYDRRRHHHCFLCGKHFPLRSRPVLNSQNEKLFEDNCRVIHGDNKDADGADICIVHSNYPHFDIDKVWYRGHEDENKKLPDLTIGLLSWSKNTWKNPPGMEKSQLEDFLKHDLVWPFRHDILQELEDGNYLKPLFHFPKTRRQNNPSINFPFAIWEAKKHGTGTGTDPVVQNALKVKQILEWQEDMGRRANVAWDPLVFHFVSVGSEWKLYACHIAKIPRTGQNSYPFRLLWSGDCTDETVALQLLYIIDIIALWGQFQYKPFVAACVRIFWKRLRSPFFRWTLRTNLLKDQKPIDTRTFRSLASHGLGSIQAQIAFTLQRAGTNTPVGVVEDEILQGIREISLKNYYLPERDGFIWLLHRELYRDTDLLVVRVNNEGRVLQPLVVFEESKSNWQSPDFERILTEERARMPPKVQVDFRYDKDDTSVLKKCFNVNNGHCTGTDIQFCAILPLTDYGSSDDDWSGQESFRSLEECLGLQNLIDAADTANEQWCICRQPGTGPMILCDAKNCAVGWYHFECENLPTGFEQKVWLCSTCEKNAEKIRFPRKVNQDLDEELLAASDERIQRVRSLHRVWNEHIWPHPTTVYKIINRKISFEIQMERNWRRFKDTVSTLEATGENTSTRCWAIYRDNPSLITQVHDRFGTPLT